MEGEAGRKGEGHRRDCGGRCASYVRSTRSQTFLGTHTYIGNTGRQLESFKEAVSRDWRASNIHRLTNSFKIVYSKPCTHIALPCVYAYRRTTLDSKTLQDKNVDSAE